jgi:hypothetical protein
MARNHDLRLSNDKFAGIFNPYDYDPPELAPMPPYCAECGDRRVNGEGEELCNRCKEESR